MRPLALIFATPFSLIVATARLKLSELLIEVILARDQCPAGRSEGATRDQTPARALVARRAIDDCAVRTGANPWDAEPQVRAVREEPA